MSPHPAPSKKGPDTTVDGFDTPEDKGLVRKIDLQYVFVI